MARSDDRSGDAGLGKSTGSRRALGLEQVPGLGDSPARAQVPADPPASRRTGLTALLLVLVAVAVALAAQSVIGYRRSVEVEHLLGRSQAEQLQRLLAPSLRGARDEAALDHTLARLLDEHRADGLRYLAVLGPGGTLRAEAGVSAEPSTVIPPPGPGRRTPDRRLGARWRVYTPLPLRTPPADVASSLDPRPPPGPPPGMPPPFVVEVEPTAGRALHREATRSLVVGLASSLALGALAFLLRRWIRRHDLVSARHAHDRRLAALGEMSAVLAHEIRNPLASLKGHAQLLVEDLDGDDRRRDRVRAQRVVDEAVRLERLTDDLLAFARTGRIERAPCEPAAVLTAAAASLDAGRITVDTSGAPSRWSLDAGRMTQVLTNLLANALEAAPGQPVRAAITVEGSRLVYRVRDRGPGLPPGGVARLVEPFHTTRSKGTGLGLAVAHRLVALHGGTLEGRSHPDGGAELIVSLPPEGR